MDAVRLSIIVASTGRATLRQALESATAQMRPGDELILVFDDSGDAGDTPRNRVLDSATGSHLVFLDDDDEFTSGALDVIRRFAATYPGRIGIFRLDFGAWGTTWREEERELVCTATAMYVVPNVRGKVGRFGRVPGIPSGRMGDYRFIVETVALQGEPVWRPEIVQRIKPEHSRLRRLRHRLRLRTRIRRLLGLPTAPDPKRPARRYPEAERWASQHLTGGPAEAATPERD